MWQTLHAQWVCDSKRHFRLVLLLLSLSVLRLLLLLLVTTFISRPATFVAVFYGLLCVSGCGKDFLHLRKQLPTQTEQLCLPLYPLSISVFLLLSFLAGGNPHTFVFAFRWFLMIFPMPAPSFRNFRLPHPFIWKVSIIYPNCFCGSLRLLLGVLICSIRC